MLPGDERRSLFKTTTFFGLSALGILTSFLLMRLNLVMYDLRIIAFVYLAVLWSFLGPYLIWRYEHITLKNYWAGCRQVVADKKSYLKYKKGFIHSIARGHLSTAILICWTLLVVFAFFASFNFMKGLGIKSYSDPWWIIQVICIAVYAYITGIGFLGVLRTLLLIEGFLQLEVKVDPYHPDGRGGLGFVGKFLAETGLIFSSGSVFIPILITVLKSQSGSSGFLVLFLVTIYAAMIALSFIVPVWLVHLKLQKEKDETIKVIGKKLRELKKLPTWALYYGSFLYENSLRNEYHDVLSA